MEYKDLMTIQEVAVDFGVHYNTILKWKKGGRFRFIRFFGVPLGSKRIRARREDVERERLYPFEEYDAAQKRRVV